MHTNDKVSSFDILELLILYVEALAFEVKIDWKVRGMLRFMARLVGRSWSWTNSDPDRDSNEYWESLEDESDVVNFGVERLTGDVDAVLDCRYVSVVWFAV